jgi:Spherulation-specific family 4
MIHSGRFSMLGRAGLLSLAFVIAGVVAGLVAQAADAQNVAVAAYFYPGPYWTQMNQAGAGAIAVMNPNSGPGSGPDSNYVSAVQSAEAAGVTVVGYVYTNYATRSLGTVESEVDNYYHWYPVQGIFFDEASINCADEPYYAQLNSYVKAKGGIARTILNPGTATSQCYVPAADTLLTWEGTYSDYVNSYSAPSWVTGYPASHFWHIVFSTPSTSSLANAVQLSQSRNAGYVFVTSAGLPNPYSQLPSYWSTELSDIAGGTTTPPPSKPTNTVAPVISGSPTQGQVLSTTSGSWNGYPTPSYTYRWQDCNSSGGSCTNISGATGSSYTLTAADVGHTIVVVVTAANTQGSASASSAATAVVQSPSSGGGGSGGGSGSPPSGFKGGDYSVESNSVSLSGTGQALATQATIASTGTLKDMVVYQTAGISGSPSIEAAIYADSNGYPGKQIGDSASNALSSAGWLDMGGLQAGSGSLNVTAGQKVWLIIHIQGSSTLKLAEKGGCTGQGWKLTNSPTWLDDPWTTGGTATSDCSVSAYVT